MKLNFRRPAFPAGVSVWHPASLIAHWFGAGLMPVASGTFGSLAALPFAWAIQHFAGTAGLALATAAVAAAGWWAAEVLVAKAASPDHGYIVVDEVAGMWLTLLFAPQSWLGYTVAFVLFRAADVLKPFPADWCDRHAKGGLGVMLDDLVAALWAGAGTWLIAALAARYGLG